MSRKIIKLQRTINKRGHVIRDDVLEEPKRTIPSTIFTSMGSFHQGIRSAYENPVGFSPTSICIKDELYVTCHDMQQLSAACPNLEFLSLQMESNANDCFHFQLPVSTLQVLRLKLRIHSSKDMILSILGSILQVVSYCTNLQQFEFILELNEEWYNVNDSRIVAISDMVSFFVGLTNLHELRLKNYLPKQLNVDETDQLVSHLASLPLKKIDIDTNLTWNLISIAKIAELSQNISDWFRGGWIQSDVSSIDPSIVLRMIASNPKSRENVLQLNVPNIFSESIWKCLELYSFPSMQLLRIQAPLKKVRKISMLPSMRSFQISYLEHREDLHQWLSKMPYVRILSFDSCNIRGFDFTSLPYLEEMNVIGGSFSQQDAEKMSKSISLVRLCIHYKEENNFTKSIVQHNLKVLFEKQKKIIEFIPL